MFKNIQSANRTKYNTKKRLELHPLEIQEGLWQEISINIIRPLLQLKGKDAIVVIVDQFTKIT